MPVQKQSIIRRVTDAGDARDATAMEPCPRSAVYARRQTGLQTSYWAGLLWFGRSNVRLDVYIVVDHDLPVTTSLLHNLQQASAKPPFRIEMKACRGAALKVRTQLRVSHIATSGFRNRSETTWSCNLVPRKGPLKMTSCRSRNAWRPVKNIPGTFVKVPSLAKCREYPSVSP